MLRIRTTPAARRTLTVGIAVAAAAGGFLAGLAGSPAEPAVIGASASPSAVLRSAWPPPAAAAAAEPAAVSATPADLGREIDEVLVHLGITGVHARVGASGDLTLTGRLAHDVDRRALLAWLAGIPGIGAVQDDTVVASPPHGPARPR